MSLLGLKAPVTLAVWESLGLSDLFYSPPKSDIQYLTKATQQMNTAAPTILKKAGDQ